MRYALVSTTNYLLLVDLQTKRVQPLEGDRGEYYGISWFANSSALVLSHSGVNNADLRDVSSYAQSEQGWLSAGDLSTGKFLSAPHQLICAPDGRVVCTNTGRNAITVIDLARPGHYQEARLSEARWDRLSAGGDTADHLNSVYLHGGQLHVIAHRFHKGSQHAVFSYPDLQLLQLTQVPGRSGLHNLWITAQGQRISCHSEAGGVLDLDTRHPLWVSQADVYTRGLAACADYVLVGESQKTGRAARSSSLSGLWLLDRHSWRALDHLCLGPYGAVNEVRLLDVPDQAHHGVVYGALPALLKREGMFDHLSRARLAGAALGEQNRQLWQEYELVFGAVRTRADAAMHCAGDALCLLVARRPGVSRIACHYQLDDGVPAHVAAVWGYGGNGADRQMCALLLQRGEHGAAGLAVWRENGEAWRRLPDWSVEQLPLQGHMALALTQGQAVLYIDGIERLRLDAAAVGLVTGLDVLGIRWSGAWVRPDEAASTAPSQATPLDQQRHGGDRVGN